MPFLEKSSYTHRPRYLFNAHLETIIPSMFYQVVNVSYQRERMELADGDFLDLDWLSNEANRLVILSHGLEGSSDRHYIQRTAGFFNKLGWDALAWNCRSCSGHMNRLPKLYHHGDISDLSLVIDHAIGRGYESIVLIGFSMGGNMLIKYLGVKGEDVHPSIKGGIGFSVPCNLADSASQLVKGFSRIYERRFLKKLRNKLAAKAQNHPEYVKDWTNIADFWDFHKKFTLPVYGFDSLDAFHDQARSDIHIPNIRIPTLMINAKNDPMLGMRNYPIAAAEKSDYFFLEIPKVGGHVGFTLSHDPHSWMEYRAHKFVQMLSL